MNNNVKFSVKNLNLYYGKFHALKGIDMDVPLSACSFVPEPPDDPDPPPAEPELAATDELVFLPLLTIRYN